MLVTRNRTGFDHPCRLERKETAPHWTLCEEAVFYSPTGCKMAKDLANHGGFIACQHLSSTHHRRLRNHYYLQESHSVPLRSENAVSYVLCAFYACPQIWSHRLQHTSSHGCEPTTVRPWLSKETWYQTCSSGTVTYAEKAHTILSSSQHA